MITLVQRYFTNSYHCTLRSLYVVSQGRILNYILNYLDCIFSIPVNYFVKLYIYVECILDLQSSKPTYLVCSCTNTLDEYPSALCYPPRTTSKSTRVYIVGCQRETNYLNVQILPSISEIMGYIACI